MSLFGLFDIGKSSILATQTALNVTSNNIANVNTPGFCREEVILDIVTPTSIGGNFIGRGVTVSGIKRHYDNFITLQLIGQNQNYGRSTALEQGLSQVEQIFNEAKGLGLSGYLRDYFNAWQDVATNPEGQPQRTVLLQKANALVQSAKQMENGLLDTLRQINGNIADIADRINSIAANIASLNEKIVQLEAGLGTEKASSFRDERDRLFNELGELVEFNSYEDKNGAVTITVGRKNLVEGTKVNTLSTAADIEGDNNIFLGGEDITSLLNKGQIGGYIAAREEIKSTSLHDLRKLVASIVKETNLLHNSGYGLDGTTGNNFFNPLGTSYFDDFSDGNNDGWTIVAGTWAVEGQEYSGDDSGGVVAVTTMDKVQTTNNMAIETDFYSYTDLSSYNGFIIFDYNGPNDFKYAGARDGANYWTIGYYDGSFNNIEQYPETIDSDKWYRMRMTTDGIKTTLYVDSGDGNGFVKKVEADFGSIGSGSVGLTTDYAHAHFDNFLVTSNSSPLSTKDYSSGAYITSAEITNLSALTLDEYDIKFADASNYEVYNHQTGVLLTSGAYSAGNPINFDGVRVVIDGAPAANDSFFISPLTDVIKNFGVAVTDPQKVAASLSGTTLPGDNTLALQIAQLSQSNISNLNGATFGSYYSGLVSTVGSMSRAASDSLTFDDNLRFELEKRREAVSGVSLDEEAANLIRFQRSFEAGARIISVTDELLQTIINL